jgi:carbamoyltransferase
MKILGISAFYHDSAASLLIDGKIIAAAQEERFSRRKHDSSYPKNAIDFVLSFAKIKISDLDYIVFYEKPFLKFERLLETYLAFAPKGFVQFSKAIPVWINEKLFQKKFLLDNINKNNNGLNFNKKLFFSEHHMSHAASAFFPSPFNEAIIFTADGVGEWATTTVAIGNGNKISIEKEIHFPHSLGLLYSAFTYYIGFKVNSGEYKLMGLAPYGKPIYSDLILNNLIDIAEDGSFNINQKYFNYSTGLTMTNKNFNNLFGQHQRNPLKDKLTQFHMDIAASIQLVTENILVKILSSLRKEYSISNLCLAGGVALNCVANGKIHKNKIFENIWIQPAAGDAGGSLGAALALWHIQLDNPRNLDEKDLMKGSYLGPEYNNDEVEKALSKLGANFKKLNDNEIYEKTALSLANGFSVGWFQGRMEFGPRALGSRSILGDARSPHMQKNLNLKIKFRESFRPFAPSILEEDLNEWFDLDIESPYMLFVGEVTKKKRIQMNKNDKELFGIDKLNVVKSVIPAVTHVDYSARIQTVNEKTNKKYYNLIKKFKEKTGCPIVVNTSFNVRGEPIVNNPEDAFNCFIGTDLDILVIGNFYLEKKNQKQLIKKDYKNRFEPD